MRSGSSESSPLKFLETEIPHLIKTYTLRRPKSFLLKCSFWEHVVKKGACTEHASVSTKIGRLSWCGITKMHRKRRGELVTPTTVGVIHSIGSTCNTSICYLMPMHRISKQLFCPQETYLKTSPFKYCLHHHRFKV